MAPSTLTATAALRSRSPILATTSVGSVPAGTSRTAPSGRVRRSGANALSGILVNWAWQSARSRRYRLTNPALHGHKWHVTEVRVARSRMGRPFGKAETGAIAALLRGFPTPPSGMPRPATAPETSVAGHCITAHNMHVVRSGWMRLYYTSTFIEKADAIGAS